MTFASVAFVGVMLVVAVLVAALLRAIWSRYFRTMKMVERDGGPFPSPTIPVIITIVVITSCVIGGAVSWNVLQSQTTSISRYENTAEVAEKEQVMAAQLPEPAELDQVRAEQKTRADTRPHEKALNDFDAAMQKEAAKIRERNSTTTSSL